MADLSGLEQFSKGVTPHVPLPIKARPDRLILAIDQSLRNTGWAVIEGSEVKSGGNLKTDAEKTGHEGSLKRALKLSYLFADLIEATQPDLIVHETPPVGNRMMRPESSLLAALALRFVAGGIEVRMIGAQKAKKRITGNGNASKKDVKAGVLALDPNLATMRPFNEAIVDAIALGWTASEGENDQD